MLQRHSNTPGRVSGLAEPAPVTQASCRHESIRPSTASATDHAPSYQQVFNTISIRGTPATHHDQPGPSHRKLKTSRGETRLWRGRTDVACACCRESMASQDEHETLRFRSEGSDMSDSWSSSGVGSTGGGNEWIKSTVSPPCFSCTSAAICVTECIAVIDS